MCLQDYQLARAEYVNRFQFTATGAGLVQLLPPNKDRTRIVFLGPSANAYTIRIGAGPTEAVIGTFQPGTAVIGRELELIKFGSMVTEAIWINSTGALSAWIYEYSLPLDPENLKRLAATGKW